MVMVELQDALRVLFLFKPGGFLLFLLAMIEQSILEHPKKLMLVIYHV